MGHAVCLWQPGYCILALGCNTSLQLIGVSGMSLGLKCVSHAVRLILGIV